MCNMLDDYVIMHQKQERADQLPTYILSFICIYICARITSIIYEMSIYIEIKYYFATQH